MGKRSRIIRAVRRNPKKFMFKGRWGYDPQPVGFDKNGNVEVISYWPPPPSYVNLVRSVLREMGYIPKAKKKSV